MIKQCALETCNNEFEDNTIPKNKKYCSRKCYKKAEYERNKDTYKKYAKREDVKKKVLQRWQKYYNKNKDKINAKKRKEYISNSEPAKERNKKYRLENQDKVKESKKQYNQKTKHIRNAKHNKRYKDDELYKLRFNMRTRLRSFLRDKGWSKECQTSKLIGCTYEELKLYLEKQFTSNMTWDNHGTLWHIDHCVPLASANSVEDLEKLCHYTNLQPLTIEENLSKGARIIN